MGGQGHHNVMLSPFDIPEGQRPSHLPLTRGKPTKPPANQQRLVVASGPLGLGHREQEFLTMGKQPQPTTARPVAPYIGGKRNLAARICKIIDQHPHKTYAEPFVGMGGVFLRRTNPAKAEFINDASRDVYNLFRILQEHYVPFLDLMRFQITTQANFVRLVATDPSPLTDLQRPARFLYIQRPPSGRKLSSPTFGPSGARPARFHTPTLDAYLEALHERLSGVTVMCLDFAEFLRRIDRSTALFYLDPPYFGCESDYGKDVFQRSDFERLSERLSKLKGTFILSINDVPEIRDLFAWATIASISTTYTIGKSNSSAAAELLISNLPDLEERLDGPPIRTG